MAEARSVATQGVWGIRDPAPPLGGCRLGDWGFGNPGATKKAFAVAKARSVATQGVWGIRDPAPPLGGCRLGDWGFGNPGATKKAFAVAKARSVATQGVWGIRDPAPPTGGCRLGDWGLGNLGPRKKPSRWRRLFSWSQQGMILRPPDYESGATNQLSYGTNFCVFQAICGVRTALQLAVKTHKFKEL